MSEFINIVGFQFNYKNFLLYCDWLLLFSMVFIVYAAYSTGTAREKKEKRDREKREDSKVVNDAQTFKATPKKESVVEKKNSTAVKKEITGTIPATTPKKRTPRKKAGEEDLGHVMSPEGRRSMRLKTKVDETEE